LVFSTETDIVVIEVLELSGGGVRLGISAPASITIDREEIFERKFPSVQLPPKETNY
jgi:carbon storage regulator CsrA